jgi:hypothetical protein
LLFADGYPAQWLALRANAITIGSRNDLEISADENL